MTLKSYFEKLSLIISEHPELLDKDIIYSQDDEGNSFNKINYGPSIGVYDSNEKNYIAIYQFEDYDYTEKDINTVCIN